MKTKKLVRIFYAVLTWFFAWPIKLFEKFNEYPDNDMEEYLMGGAILQVVWVLGLSVGFFSLFVVK